MQMHIFFMYVRWKMWEWVIAKTKSALKIVKGHN